MASHQELQDLYGIPQGHNPYTRQALNPLKEPTHLQLVLRVQPFDVLDQVDVYLQQCIQDNRTAFVLVTGESGTGRSSIANTILASYRNQLIEDSNQRSSRFFLPDMPALNEDPFSVYAKWVYNLRNALYFRRHLLNPPASFFADIDTVYAARTSDDYDSKFQQFLGDISFLLSNQPEPAGFGLLMEGVPNPKFIASAREMFQYARAVCVLTVPSIQPEVVSAFNNAFPDLEACLVRLAGLQGQVIIELLKARWNGANSYPFNDAGVQQAFKQPFPIAKVLYIVSSLLDIRAREKRDGPPWPGNPALCFTHDDLVWGIEYFSKSWR